MKPIRTPLQRYWSGRFARMLAGTTVLALATSTAWPQLDPAPREILHLGAEASLTDQGPVGAYAFYYWNVPSFPTTNQILRLVIAPTYVNSELGFKELLGPKTDLGVGVFGGLMSQNYSEVDGGHYYKEQSFQGNDIGANVSLYHRFNPDQMIPLTGVLRQTVDYIGYQRNQNTAGNFEVPGNQPDFTTRIGVRWGGKEPVLTPVLGLEISAWYELEHRANADKYGYANNEQLQSTPQRIFARAQLNFTPPSDNYYLVAGLQGGAAFESDKLSCFRLGGVLPYTKEYPLFLPGYYYQELSAQDFGLAYAMYALPFGPDKRWFVLWEAAAALVNYEDNTGQAGAFNSGIGGGIGYAAPSKRWKIFSLLGYGFEAQREDGRGGYSLALAFQDNFGATKMASDEAYEQMKSAFGESAGANY